MCNTNSPYYGRSLLIIDPDSPQVKTQVDYFLLHAKAIYILSLHTNVNPHTNKYKTLTQNSPPPSVTMKYNLYIR